MNRHYPLLSLVCLLTMVGRAQDSPSSLLNIGDQAPALRVQQWIKGAPVQGYEKGKVYVIEFWATWCRPCIAAIPHLSDLAQKYQKQVSVIGIDVKEAPQTPLSKITSFVDSMGPRMDYFVATEDPALTQDDWQLKKEGIPKCVVVNQEGLIAWIGHPHNLDDVLASILNNTWDIKKAAAHRQDKKRLDSLGRAAYYELLRYSSLKPGDPGKPDSALWLIHQMVKKEPGLQYTGPVAALTFIALLKTDPQKACVFGRELLTHSTFENSLADIVYGNIESYSNPSDLPTEIFQLAAEAYQVDIDFYPYINDIDQIYYKMAAMYRRANNPSEAAASEKKALMAAQPAVQ